MEENELLQHFTKSVVPAMVYQIKSDYVRWGDTWKHRPKEGQEGRIINRILQYHQEWMLHGTPIPWLKIIGLCNIAMIREWMMPK